MAREQQVAIATSQHLPVNDERVDVSLEGQSIRARAIVAAAEAARHAETVDGDARFPSEALAALKELRLLGLFIAPGLGGEGASVGDVADACYAIGRACASAGLMYAMHQINVACLVRHSGGNGWQERLQRDIAEKQLLLASSTTEGSRGGDIRSSEAAVQTDNSRISLRRDASVISYGEYADVIVTTARRDETSAGSDQVLVAFEKGDYTLERTYSWDTLGMRGTCSGGFILHAQGVKDQILADSYEIIHGQTMMPLANLLWSSVWTGIAAGAVQRARAFVRKARGGAAGKLPPGAAHLTRARASLETLRGAVQAAIGRYEFSADDARRLSAIDMQTALNLLKVETSELAVGIVLSAMRASGLAGYRNDGEFSMGRYLRDILSSPIMISNDRIIAGAQLPTLLGDAPASLLD
jgi:acyl-CoA dehydrogenase